MDCLLSFMVQLWLKIIYYILNFFSLLRIVRFNLILEGSMKQFALTCSRANNVFALAHILVLIESRLPFYAFWNVIPILTISIFVGTITRQAPICSSCTEQINNHHYTDRVQPLSGSVLVQTFLISPFHYSLLLPPSFSSELTMVSSTGLSSLSFHVSSLLVQIPFFSSSVLVAEDKVPCLELFFLH